MFPLTLGTQLAGEDFARDLAFPNIDFGTYVRTSSHPVTSSLMTPMQHLYPQIW